MLYSERPSNRERRTAPISEEKTGKRKYKRLPGFPQPGNGTHRGLFHPAKCLLPGSCKRPPRPPAGAHPREPRQTVGAGVGPSAAALAKPTEAPYPSRKL